MQHFGRSYISMHVVSTCRLREAAVASLPRVSRLVARGGPGGPSTMGSARKVCVYMIERFVSIFRFARAV